MRACERMTFYTILLLFSLLGMSGNAPCAYAAKELVQKDQNSVLQGLKVLETSGGTRIEIMADKPFTYTDYSITEPPRAIIDLPFVDAGSVKPPAVTDSKIIKKIEVMKNNSQGGMLTRIVLELEKNADFTVAHDTVDKNKIIVSFSNNNGSNPTGGDKVKAAEQGNGNNKDVESARHANVNEAIRTKNTIYALNIAGEGIEIVSDSGIDKYKTFKLAKPERLIIDVFGVSTSLVGKVVPINSFGVINARLGSYPDKTRIVFDASGSGFPNYKIEKTDKGLLVVLADTDKENKSSAAAKRIEAANNVQPVAPVSKNTNSNIESIDFKVIEDYSRIIITSDTVLAIEKPVKTGEGFVVTVNNSILPKKLQRPFETKAFASSVMKITPYQVKTRTGYNTKILVKLRGDVPFELKPMGNIAHIDVKNLIVPESTPVVPVRQPSPQVSSARPQEEVQRDGTITMPGTGKKVYTGRRVTLEFADADIRKIFQLIAEVSNLNFIIGDDVTGTISIKLVNVPWDQALDVILETKGLGMKREGNIVQIRPIGKIQSLAEERQAQKLALEGAMELRIKVFDVNYAAVADIEKQFNSVKSKNGIISQDSRTNRVIVTDIEPALERMTSLLKALDIPEKQVMIEARIVEATSDFSRNLGIQWGLHYKDGSASFLGINQLDTSFGGVVNNLAPSSGFLPSTSSGIATGLSFGKLTNNIQIDLRLSAAESTGQVKIISTPKVVTLNNKAAKISQGQSIPYQTTSAEGTKTEFVEAALTLEVTPHITADGSISMKIKASNNSPGQPVEGSTAPPINKKEATTELLVKNGETTVIGGIYVNNDSTADSGVPFLKDIPLLGWLFKSNTRVSTKTELLIFITPKIVS